MERYQTITTATEVSGNQLGFASFSYVSKSQGDSTARTWGKTSHDTFLYGRSYIGDKPVSWQSGYLKTIAYVSAISCHRMIRCS
ncbi:hypothetical protein M404DRAFT_1004554 [Pisolithus tinctorius Marx 270]|uniref:Uncharacterized protein n=1 Tax=Pisolithus tinctorius Marx 270 TaxID=870435 RepID=A0A0C3NEW4_PISTI|nr:hypothetical protein M404DRAFT_1004554 [Pisolithus tinctorius Marx 270]